MEDHLDFRCVVCLECYSDKRSPRNLDCGHCVCTLCLKAMEECDNSKECPECRRYYKAQNYLDLKINHPLLRFGRMCAFAREYPDNTSSLDLSLRYPDPKPETICAGKCAIHGHGLYFSCLRCDTYVCRECLLCDHMDSPYGYCNISDIKELLDSRKLPLKTKFELDLKKINSEKGKYVRISKRFKKVFEFANENINNHNYSENEKVLRTIIKQEEEVESQIKAFGTAVEKIKETIERLLKANWLEEMNSFYSVSWEALPTSNKYKIKGITRKLQYLESAINIEVQNSLECEVKSPP